MSVFRHQPYDTAHQGTRNPYAPGGAKNVGREELLRTNVLFAARAAQRKATENGQMTPEKLHELFSLKEGVTKKGQHVDNPMHVSADAEQMAGLQFTPMQLVINSVAYQRNSAANIGRMDDLKTITDGRGRARNRGLGGLTTEVITHHTSISALRADGRFGIVN